MRQTRKVIVQGLAERRVLVTGGAGFIGSHIVEQLGAAGADVTVIDDLSSGSAANLPSGTRLQEWDIADARVIQCVSDADPEIVIHAAAQVSVSASVADPERDRSVNLRGTEHVLAGARNARRFVFVSSGGAVYGEADQARETDLPAPASPYGIHKLAAEWYVRTSGVPFSVVRYANVYGPRQRTDLEGGVVAIFTERLVAGLPITVHGDGKQSRDFVYVEDVAEATLASSLSEVSGVWNVSCGSTISIVDLLSAIENMSGLRAERVAAERRAGDITSSSLSNRKIIRELGWRPRHTLAEGLAITIASERAEASQQKTAD